MPKEAIHKKLIELWYTKRHENLSESEAKFKIDLYSKKLLNYPADCVADALCFFENKKKWFPYFDDLKECIESITYNQRLAIKNKLEELLINI